MLPFRSRDPEDAKIRVPTLSFLIKHPTNGEKLVFDLGLRRDWENYPPPVSGRIEQFFGPLISIPDVPESLQRGGLTTDDINDVVISHVHWDHIGNPDLFKKSNFIVGHGSKNVLTNGAPLNDKSAFNKDLLPHDGRTKELPPLSDDKWQDIGPFKGIDHYGDGSVYLLDAPGHLPGHANLLARMGPSSWLYLAGDACHDRRLLTGEKEFAVRTDAQGNTTSAHSNIEQARQTLKNINALEELAKKNGQILKVILAHDYNWFQENE